MRVCGHAPAKGAGRRGAGGEGGGGGGGARGRREGRRAGRCLCAVRGPRIRRGCLSALPGGSSLCAASRVPRHVPLSSRPSVRHVPLCVTSPWDVTVPRRRVSRRCSAARARTSQSLRAAPAAGSRGRSDGHGPWAGGARGGSGRAGGGGPPHPARFPARPEPPRPARSTPSAHTRARRHARARATHTHTHTHARARARRQLYYEAAFLALDAVSPITHSVTPPLPVHPPLPVPHHPLGHPPCPPACLLLAIPTRYPSGQGGLGIPVAYCPMSYRSSMSTPSPPPPGPLLPYTPPPRIPPGYPPCPAVSIPSPPHPLVFCLVGGGDGGGERAAGRVPVSPRGGGPARPRR